MRKSVFIVLVLLVSVALAGCGKKPQPLEEMQEPLSMEAMSNLNATSGTAVTESKATEVKTTATIVPPVQSGAVQQTELQPLPPSGPYKPTGVEIQTALKNAGYYTGSVDGKVGPLTKKAVEEFQKANNMQADGKVGPKTWTALSGYLNPVTPAPVTGGKKKR